MYPHFSDVFWSSEILPPSPLEVFFFDTIHRSPPSGLRRPREPSARMKETHFCRCGSILATRCRLTSWAHSLASASLPASDPFSLVHVTRRHSGIPLGPPRPPETKSSGSTHGQGDVPLYKSSLPHECGYGVLLPADLGLTLHLRTGEMGTGEDGEGGRGVGKYGKVRTRKNKNARMVLLKKKFKKFLF